MCVYYKIIPTHTYTLLLYCDTRMHTFYNISYAYTYITYVYIYNVWFQMYVDFFAACRLRCCTLKPYSYVAIYPYDAVPPSHLIMMLYLKTILICGKMLHLKAILICSYISLWCCTCKHLPHACRLWCCTLKTYSYVMIVIYSHIWVWPWGTMW
jgi:hypothetical protein